MIHVHYFPGDPHPGMILHIPHNAVRNGPKTARWPLCTNWTSPDAKLSQFKQTWEQIIYPTFPTSAISIKQSGNVGRFCTVGRSGSRPSLGVHTSEIVLNAKS